MDFAVLGEINGTALLALRLAGRDQGIGDWTRRQARPITNALDAEGHEP
jgi:hypothetical protein